MSKSVEKSFDTFRRFLTFFALRENCRKVSKNFLTLFDDFCRFLTWPLSAGPFCNPLTIGQAAFFEALLLIWTFSLASDQTASLTYKYGEMKRDKLNGTNTVPAKFCGFLRLSARLCASDMLQFPGTAKICKNQRKTADSALLVQFSFSLQFPLNNTSKIAL